MGLFRRKKGKERKTGDATVLTRFVCSEQTLELDSSELDLGQTANQIALEDLAVKLAPF